MTQMITVQTEEAARMVDEVIARAGSDAVTQVVERVAQDATRMITGVPRGATGDLASPSSFQVRARRNAASVVNTTPYARFVFRGTRYMEARPPNVPSDQLARTLSDELARLVR